jgi:hypothetical protein
VQSAAAAAAAEAAAAAAAEGRPVAVPPPKPSGGAVDHAVLRRIHFLYTRALRKFKGDLRLWVRRMASHLFPVTPAGTPLRLLPRARRLARALARLRQRCVTAFAPDEGSVTEEYWPYARWRFVQRTASQALTVLATQQMLRAVGLGACAPAARRRARAEPLPAQAPAGACPPLPP